MPQDYTTLETHRSNSVTSRTEYDLVGSGNNLMTGSGTPASIGSLLVRAAENWPDRPSRIYPVEKGHRTVSHNEFLQDIFVRASQISSLGLSKGDRAVIIGETGYEWSLTDFACQTLGIVTVPIYPTLPPDQAQFIFDDCQAKVAFCQDDEQAAKLTGANTLVWTDSSKTPQIQASTATLDREAWLAGIAEVAPSDVATFIYTSGTTGNPKGAMLTHDNFVFLCLNIQDSLPVDQNDVFLSWLPVSHVFERFVSQSLTTYIGACVVYSNVTTMAADMANFKPTVVIAVPRLLESIRSRAVEAARKESPLKQRLFDLALKLGGAKVAGKSPLLFPLVSKVVGARVRARTGGSLRFFVSGGAALPPPVSEFYAGMGITVLQGYGLTETTAATCLNHPDDNRPKTVGPPIKGVELKIAQDGEILIRGRSVMVGYHNLPGATAEAIDSDGWFHSGDIGRMDGQSLQITDRKKDILVLGNGKNVAPQPIESRLKESEFIAEAVVLGDGMEYCCSLVVPDFERFKLWLKQKGEPAQTEEEIAAREDVKAQVKSEIDAANKGLADFERIKRHVLLPKPFSVDSGELTPSLKVRRKVVKERYADLIRSMQKP